MQELQNADVFEINIKVGKDGEVKEKAYIVNELTGFQDQMLARLFKDSDLTSVFSGNAVSISEDKIIPALLSMLGEGKLNTFLSIILVPKEHPVYRESYASELLIPVGDLTNGQIKEIVTHFFGKNVPSLTSMMKSLTSKETHEQEIHPGKLKE